MVAGKRSPLLALGLVLLLMLPGGAGIASRPTPSAAPTVQAAAPSLSGLAASMGLGSAGPLVGHPRPGVRPAGTTYHVSNLGSDTAPCSSAQPCRQVSEALALVAPGDTIMVANGTYLGFDVSSLAGTAAQPITIEAPGRGAVLVNTVNRSDNRDIVHVLTSSHIVLDGLEAFGANRAAVRIDQSDNITVTNGTFGNNTVWGIFTDFDKYSVIEHDTCYGSVQQHGIYVSNSPVAPRLRWDKVYSNYGAGIQINADATQGGWGISSGGDVEDNVIYGNGAGGGAALNFDGVWNTRVVNNLLYDNHATGIVNYYLDGRTGPHGMTIMDNTVVMASNGRWALQLLSTTGENYVRNNILDNLNPAHGGEEFGTWGDVANTSSDHEIEDRVTVDAVGTVYTLAQWRGMGYEPNSLSASPSSLFVNPGAGDYHLLSTAPAIAAGQFLGNVTDDLDGAPRPLSGPPDIGCYQHAGAASLSASIAASPPSGTAPLVVIFSSTVSGGQGPYAYAWSFGDGSGPSAFPGPQHTYNATGRFAVNLTVSDAGGNLTHAFLNVSVSAPPPLVVSGSANPAVGPAPLTVAFSASATGGRAPYTYRWTFGDGSPASGAPGPTHTYNSSGTYPASVEVNDSFFHHAWSNLSITASATPPPLLVSPTASPAQGTAPLTVLFSPGVTGGTPPYTYLWGFGDGGSRSSAASPAHTYTQAGSFTALLTVTDSAGAYQSGTTSVSVRPAPPPLTVRLGGASAGTVGGTPPLNFWAAASGGGGGSFSFDWNFGDGSGWQSTGAANTTAHAYSVAGTFSVEVYANDTSGGSRESAPWTVAISGSPPPVGHMCLGGMACGVDLWVWMGAIAVVLALVAAVAWRRRTRGRRGGAPPGAGPCTAAQGPPASDGAVGPYGDPGVSP